MGTEKTFELGDTLPAPMTFTERNIRGTVEYKTQPGEQLSAAHPKYQELVRQARADAERNLKEFLQNSDLDVAEKYIPIVTGMEVDYETERRETPDGVIYAVTATISASGVKLPAIMAHWRPYPTFSDPEAFNRWWWRFHVGPVPPPGGYPPPAPPPPPPLFIRYRHHRDG